MRLWLEQEKNPSESTTILRLPHIQCHTDQKERLLKIAQSTLSIWRIKRAKIILGALEGKTLESLVVNVRVPPESIVKCVEAFSKHGLNSLRHPTRKPTWREARVEKMLCMLEKPSEQKGEQWKSFTVRYIGIDFNGPMIQRIREIILTHPEAKRAKLARMICREYAFYSPAGKTKNVTLADILKRMDMDNLVRLPKVTPRGPHRKKKTPPPAILEHQEKRLLHIKDLVPLKFTLIRKPRQQQLWNTMMGGYHYLKNPKLFGPQLRYIIGSANGEFGAKDSQENHGTLLGGIAFSHAAWRLASRDAFIGWDNRQREMNLNRIICNSRFLILPWIQCPNLASMVLGRIARQVSSDWKAAYGIQPVLLETFVQQNRFQGTCYRAANWIEAGRTSGYSYFSSQKKTSPPKTVFLYPLRKNFRKILCQTS